MVEMSRCKRKHKIQAPGNNSKYNGKYHSKAFRHSVLLSYVY